mmetsp:Transcript_35723/g.43112  ORF Transcript_35723/g.43112 Transcript_35723/m.43112 type:complete len:96 (+) Transcript_35723:707-994(+)
MFFFCIPYNVPSRYHPTAPHTLCAGGAMPDALSEMYSFSVLVSDWSKAGRLSDACSRSRPDTIVMDGALRFGAWEDIPKSQGLISCSSHNSLTIW